MCALQKAVIKVYRNPIEEITCLFNPSEYRINASAGYSQESVIQGGQQVKQYVGGMDSSLSLTLYCDATSESGGKSDVSIKEYVKKLENLLVLDEQEKKPYYMEFIWGDLIYKGYLISLNQEFNYFDKNGRQLRAKLDLTISPEPRGKAGKNPPTSLDKSAKSRVVAAGETIWMIAQEEYGDCGKWVQIANYNQLMDPRDLHPGQVLKLPPL